MKNEIRLDFADNPAVRNLFGRHKAGDKTKLVLRLQINNVTEQGVDGTIESLASGDDIDLEDDDETDETEPQPKKVAPDADEPIAVLVSGGKGSTA
jgi:hypothetical protein